MTQTPRPAHASDTAAIAAFSSAFSLTKSGAACERALTHLARAFAQDRLANVVAEFRTSQVA